MTPGVFALAMAVAAVLAGCSRSPDPEASASSLVEAEARFAEAVAASGTRDAYLDVLIPSGIIFRPKPVKGIRWFEEHEADPGILSWKPVFVEVARSGDFGFTIGSWEHRAEAEGAASRGHYVSFWRKGDGGVWRLAADIGVADETAPALQDAGEPFLILPDTTAKPLTDAGVKKRRGEIFNTERDIAVHAGEEGFGPAFLEKCAADVRLYRNEAPPVIGIEAVRDRIGGEAWRIMNDPLGAFVSAAGDLGYTYGTMEFLHPGEGVLHVETLGFLRGWRRSAEGEWQIIVEAEVPVGDEN